MKINNVYIDGAGVRTQGFAYAQYMPYHLSHNLQSVLFWLCFGDGFS
jgi:hypothetical protein